MQFPVYKKIVLILILLGLVTGCRNPFEPEKTDIKGVVRDKDANVIAGATVILTPGTQYATTDNNGEYILENIRPGSYKIKAKKKGHPDGEANVEVKSTVGLSCVDPEKVYASVIELDGSSSGSDVTPPVVSSVYPSKGATNAPVSLSITATFNENLDASTVSSSTVYLNLNGNAVEGSVSYSDKVITLSPSNKLMYDTTYSVKILSDVKDTSGNKMSSDYAWNFKTKTSDTLEYSGKGNKVVENILLSSGSAKFSLTHDGDSTFIVDLKDKDAKKIANIFSGKGVYSDAQEKSINISSSGEYQIEVAANGNWTVKIKN